MRSAPAVAVQDFVGARWQDTFTVGRGGQVTATSFAGNGAGLTDLPLPALPVVVKNVGGTVFEASECLSKCELGTHSGLSIGTHSVIEISVSTNVDAGGLNRLYLYAGYESSASPGTLVTELQHDGSVLVGEESCACTWVEPAPPHVPCAS